MYSFPFVSTARSTITQLGPTRMTCPPIVRLARAPFAVPRCQYRSVMEQLIITGATRLLLLVGDPISSVRSPQVFNRLFSEQRRDAVCAPLHVPAEELAV